MVESSRWRSNPSLRAVHGQTSKRPVLAHCVHAKNLSGKTRGVGSVAGARDILSDTVRIYRADLMKTTWRPSGTGEGCVS
jgi:hypothetical protein